MTQLKKRIRVIILSFIALILLLSGILWLVTNPSEYPYPENIELGALDRRIQQEYEIRTLELEDDYSGKVVATLLSKQLPDSLDQQKAVLYIHGYGDYFFQDHLADYYLDAGFHFFALDLRKYGRSWLPHQEPCFAKSLTEYYEEIDQALQLIKDQGHEFILLNGHSTGGLITSLYANEGKNRGYLNALLLNSPFLDWPFDPLTEKGVYALAAFGRIRPFGQAPSSGSTIYAQAIHADFKGEWDYTIAWKPHTGFPKYLGWAGAICRGQDKVAKGLDIDIPILVLHSDKSYLGTEYTEEVKTSDIILDVAHIRKWSANLGEHVQLAEIKDAMHDVFLSKKAVREQAFEEVVEWINGL